MGTTRSINSSDRTSFTKLSQNASGTWGKPERRGAMIWRKASAEMFAAPVSSMSLRISARLASCSGWVAALAFGKTGCEDFCDAAEQQSRATASTFVTICFIKNSFSPSAETQHAATLAKVFALLSGSCLLAQLSVIVQGFNAQESRSASEFFFDTQ